MVKTITIMDDAYEILKRMKKKDESFSELIRRFNKEQKTDLTKWFGILKGSKKRVKEFQEETRRIRNEISQDIEKRKFD